jgi:hypothetical protein
MSDEDKTDIESTIRILEQLANQKVSIAIQNYDYIDQNIKTVDMEMTLLEKVLRDRGVDIPQLEVPTAAVIVSDDTNNNSNNNGNQKKRKAEQISSTTTTTTESTTTTTSAEPLYCSCNRIAFGEMIACDNEDCPIEWFHYPCVNLTRKPRNSWICPLCSNKKKK